MPAITCPGVANQWASEWIGLDGYNTPTVEQDGTALSGKSFTTTWDRSGNTEPIDLG